MKINSLAWVAVAVSALLFAGCSGFGSKPDDGVTVEDRSSSGATTSGAGGLHELSGTIASA